MNTSVTQINAPQHISINNDLQDQCRQQMRSNDINLEVPIIEDGKLHRFPSDKNSREKDGWYTAFSGTSNRGNRYLCVVYGSWKMRKRGGNEKYSFKSWKDSQCFDGSEKASLDTAYQIHLKKIEDEQRLLRIEAANKAKSTWDTAVIVPAEEGLDRYIKTKGVKQYNVRFGKNSKNCSSVIIDIRNLEGDIKSIQFIFWDQAVKKWEKRFLQSGERRGTFHIINSRKIDKVDHIYLVEGWATGASVYEGCDEKDPVVVTFSAYSFEGVIQVIRTKYSNIKITIAADNDGPGIKHAQDVAKKYENIKIVTPTFPEDKQNNPTTGKKYKDFNDLHKLFGASEVGKQLSQITWPEESIEAFKELIPTMALGNDPCVGFSLEHLPPVLRDHVSNICKTTSAHPIMITCAALTDISTILKTNVVLPHTEYYQDLYANLWFLVIAKSGFFKSTALQEGASFGHDIHYRITKTIKEKERATISATEEEREVVYREIQQEKLADPIMPSDITHEAFIRYLANGHMGALFHNELGAFVQGSNDTGLMQTLTNLYDMKRGYRKLTKTQGDDVIDLPFFSIYGVSTLSWIQNSIERGEKRDVHGGFFARFLIIMPPVKKDVIPPGLPPRGAKTDPESIAIKERYFATLSNIMRSTTNGRQFTLSLAARQLFYDGEMSGIHNQLYIMCNNYNEQTKEVLSSFLKRWSPYILKIAMIMELLYDPDSNIITPRAIIAAYNILEVAIRSTGLLFENVLGPSIIRMQCNKVIEYIATRGGTIERSKLIKSGTLGDAKTKQYDEITELLIAGGEISKETRNSKVMLTVLKQE